MRRHWLGFLLLFTFLLSGLLEMGKHDLAAQVAAGWFVAFLAFALVRGVIRAGVPKIRQ